MPAEQQIAVKNARGLIAEPYVTEIRINSTLVCDEEHTFPHCVRVRGAASLIRESGPQPDLGVLDEA